MTGTAAAPAEAPPPPIEVRGLTTTFGDAVIHQNLDLVVPAGEVVALVGGSGAGKTVLLDTIIGLRPAQAGQVRIFGHDIAYARRREWTEIERRWGVLFQSGALWTNLTVLENIAAPMHEHTELPAAEIDALARLKLSLAGLPTSAADLKPAELSGGMVKRAGLARALALDPELLFLDEPTSGLDPISAAGFDALIADLSESLALTVLMITHDLDSLWRIADEVAVIADKRIVAMGSVAEVARSDQPWIREYFQGERGRIAEAAARTGAC